MYEIFRQKENMLRGRGRLKRFYHALACSRLQALSQKSTQELKKRARKKQKRHNTGIPVSEP
jgi:hypothetical protein